MIFNKKMNRNFFSITLFSLQTSWRILLDSVHTQHTRASAGKIETIEIGHNFKKVEKMLYLQHCRSIDARCFSTHNYATSCFCDGIFT
jgi:hypothetical protein